MLEILYMYSHVILSTVSDVAIITINFFTDKDLEAQRGYSPKVTELVDGVASVYIKQHGSWFLTTGNGWLVDYSNQLVLLKVVSYGR